MKKDKAAVIIVAAGQGRRMGGTVAKQYLLLKGKEILAHTVEAFEASPDIDEIILVTGVDSCKTVEQLSHTYGWKKIRAILPGGEERGDSVRCGINALSTDTQIVLIHDGVRPFVTKAMINASIKATGGTGACVVGVPVKDTIKVRDKDGFVLNTPDRSTLWQIQTPQAFSVPLIKNAYAKAEEDGFIGTDDASVVEQYGERIKIVLGDYKNIKITTQEDLFIASSFIEEGNS